MTLIVAAVTLIFGVIAYRTHVREPTPSSRRRTYAWAWAFWGGLAGSFFGVAGFGTAMVGSPLGALLGYFIVSALMKVDQSDQSTARTDQVRVIETDSHPIHWIGLRTFFVRAEDRAKESAVDEMAQLEAAHQAQLVAQAQADAQARMNATLEAENRLQLRRDQRLASIVGVVVWVTTFLVMGLLGDLTLAMIIGAGSGFLAACIALWLFGLRRQPPPSLFQLVTVYVASGFILLWAHQDSVGKHHDSPWHFLFANVVSMESWGAVLAWGAPPALAAAVVGLVVYAMPNLRTYWLVFACIAAFLGGVKVYDGIEDLKVVTAREPTAQSAETTYWQRLATYESQYPQLNPDDQRFDKALTDAISDRMDLYVGRGWPRADALTKAIEDHKRERGTSSGPMHKVAPRSRQSQDPAQLAADLAARAANQSVKAPKHTQYRPSCAPDMSLSADQSQCCTKPDVIHHDGGGATLPRVRCEPAFLP